MESIPVGQLGIELLFVAGHERDGEQARVNDQVGELGVEKRDHR